MQTTSSNEHCAHIPEKGLTESVESGSSPPMSSYVSTFDTNTIDIRLVIQPEDGHPNGRRIRHVITLDGKPLHIGAVRVKQGMELLPNLEKEQAVAQFAQWLMRLTEEQHFLTRSTIGSLALLSGGSTASATPRMATTASPSQEGSREAAQGTAARLPQTSEKTTVPRAPQPELRPETATSEHEGPHTKPEQLTLF